LPRDLLTLKDRSLRASTAPTSATGQKGIGQQLIARKPGQKQPFGKRFNRVRMAADQRVGLPRYHTQLQQIVCQLAAQHPLKRQVGMFRRQCLQLRPEIKLAVIAGHVHQPDRPLMILTQRLAQHAKQRRQPGPRRH